MLVSYILGAQTQGHDKFNDGNPSILRLQDLIEDAWAKDINVEGKTETGGILGTRKYIGTPEAQALFRGLGIPCKVGAYGDTPGGFCAWEALLASVQQYFRLDAKDSQPTSSATLSSSKVHQTSLPPIYLQRPHHSLTIVGIEIRSDGSSDLLVFDPAYSLSPSMRKAVKRCQEEPGNGSTISVGSNYARRVLKPHRRRKHQMQLYTRFETLMLTSLSDS
ncbi:MAG: hypothetical protein M1819_002782 [Sarea resinae]|nr:MAG: hypothetical protein M1819_002782 [Sarea resinae]